jgi:Ni,Fe-hydrogenase III small subunit/formate hydrogenlyase subunit 6/NADH:ubiquinone oxidoreductase subunit I
MLNVLLERLEQGFRTAGYPNVPAPPRPEHFRGLPILNESRCRGGCQECADACPTQAITHDGHDLSLDMGRCLFCTDCQEACPEGVITFTSDYRLASSTRAGLQINGQQHELAQALGEKIRRIFGRSFKLRQVSAGGCNACEADVNVLNTVVFDLSRFGIQFVASPRHADGLLITGPVTENMRIALLKAYEAIPSPKVVIAVGACAISGGPYIDHPEAHNGADSVVPVDLYVPGCPPSPWTILDGLLRLLGTLNAKHPDFARKLESRL